MSKKRDLNLLEKDTLINMIELLEEDIDCVHLYLNDKGIKRGDEEGKFSIVGRIKILMGNFK